ncbi:hypothetical protein HU200_046939 [Digitaria exilis]|uniref:Uncharacterized protein n=1 Tax=Digitaria exilis TaxID=1010633 RepID=A0A835B3D7_9POAL|nr:hypothetical protein HU200_046939 [Digitaria exilis]
MRKKLGTRFPAGGVRELVGPCLWPTNLYRENIRKQCVKRYNSFDFLTEVVNKVRRLGGADSCGDERGLPRRRKSNGSDPGMMNQDPVKCSMFAEQSEPLQERRQFQRATIAMRTYPKAHKPLVEAPAPTAAPATSSKVEEANNDHQSDWPMPDAIGNIGVGPSSFGHLTVQVDEDEDYDNED